MLNLDFDFHKRGYLILFIIFYYNCDLRNTSTINFYYSIIFLLPKKGEGGVKTPP